MKTSDGGQHRGRTKNNAEDKSREKAAPINMKGDAKARGKNGWKTVCNTMNRTYC